MFKKVVSLCLSVAVAMSLGVKKINALKIDSEVCKKLCKAKNKHERNVYKKIMENIDFYYKVKKEDNKDDPVLKYVLDLYEEQEKDNVEHFNLFYDAICCEDLYICFLDEL